ncbi:MAG: N-acetylgalactosamine-4-sulfatase [Chloroflexi bacterium]|nr:MAG: N-acetylgalactosamine-4-sulfatase [Chloroflexota bacterium]
MSATARPNVIIILTDDQGYGDLACHGNPYLKTPHLDRLCAESVCLSDFHVDPMCSPSRAALLTGRYSARTGVWSTLNGRYIMRRDEVTMAEIFAAAGYRTGMFGKWHLGDQYPYRPQDRGFQKVLTFGGGVVGEIPDYWDNDYFNAVYLRNGQPEPYEGYCTDVWFNEALSFIEESRDTPFLCYIATNAPHDPFNVHVRYSAPYATMGVPEQRARFYGMITNIDENLGRLRQRLGDLGLAENTILIFFGDNGTSGGVTVDANGFRVNGYNAGMRGKKCWAYEGGHRNACFLNWPGGGIGGGHKVSELTAHIDLLPTLIDLCQVTPTHGVRFDGRSLVPLLRGEKEGWEPRVLFIHNQQRDKPKKYKDTEVLTERWRLAVTEQWGPGCRELFDIVRDPGQTRDLLRYHQGVGKTLLEHYDRWWNDIAQHFGDYSDIVVGSDIEPVTKLTCHAWHGHKGLYSQLHVRQALVDNGFWTVEASREGIYELSLRRWPQEVDVPMRDALPARTGIPFVDDLPAGEPIPIVSARLQVGNIERSQAVGPTDRAATFRIRLEPGSTRVQTWFHDERGQTRGAYYVYVERIGPS